MCLAIPGKVIKIDGMKISVKYPEEIRQVLDGGVPLKAGDYVLVQMGVVIKKITPKEAIISQKAWKQ